MLPLLLLLPACDALFDVERHDLGPFRIAALGVIDGQASAAVWSGEGLYHSAAPTLEWSLDGQRLGEGWGLPVDMDAGVLGLTATSPEGEVRYAEVPVKEAGRVFEINRYAVTLADLSLEARLEAEVRAIETTAEAGEAVRVRLGAEDDTVARWMTAMGEGTALELEPLAADLFDEEITFDDGALISRVPLDQGFTHHLALVIDGQGGNRWSWISAAYEVEQTLLRHEGFLIPVDRSDSGGFDLVAATLVADDGVMGYRIEDAEGLADLAEADDLTPLACAEPDVPFRLAWIAEGRCPLPEVLGARVALEIW